MRAGCLQEEGSSLEVKRFDYMPGLSNEIICSRALLSIYRIESLAGGEDQLTISNSQSHERANQFSLVYLPSRFSPSLPSKQVRKSMARIKFVLNERRLALIEAQKAVRSTEGSSASASGEESLWEDITEEMDGGGSKRQ